MIVGAAATDSLFEPSMVPQLYFPPEHLAAIFLPLWLPLIMPIVVGFTKEFKKYARRRAAKAQKGETKAKQE